jgi:hypothetical protein
MVGDWRGNSLASAGLTRCSGAILTRVSLESLGHLTDRLLALLSEEIVIKLRIKSILHSAPPSPHHSLPLFSYPPVIGKISPWLLTAYLFVSGLPFKLAASLGRAWSCSLRSPSPYYDGPADRAVLRSVIREFLQDPPELVVGDACALGIQHHGVVGGD